MTSSGGTRLLGAAANNFNVLRLIAASAVLFSHATFITRAEHDFIGERIGYSVGWIAVNAFFCISGMLIYLSIMKSQSLRRYLVARILRIFPGLWVMLAVSVVVLGLFFTTSRLSSWIANLDVYRYLVGNSTLYVPQYFLPGVFENQPYAGAINGSLWTLRFEFTCYIAVAALFLVGAYKSERRFVAMTLVYFVAYFGYLGSAIYQNDLNEVLFDGSDVAKLHRLSLAFFLGMLMGRYIDYARPTWWAVIGACFVCWLTFGTALFATFLIVCIAVTVFWLAFIQSRWLVPFRSMSDYSYGIYIYAFPVQQSVQQVYPTTSALANGAISFAITVPLAALSWHFVERPALRLKSRLTARAPKA